MKKILVPIILVLSIAAYGQGDSSSSGGSDFAPEAGDISAAILLGRGNFLTTGLDVPVSSWNWSYTSVSGSAPYLNPVEPNDNQVTNIVGAEARYFLKDNLAIKLSGGAIIRKTPQRTNTPGYIDPSSDPATWIPSYSAVQSDHRRDLNLNIGGEIHFKTKYDRLYPYVGLTIPFYYASRVVYDPTILTDNTEPSNFVIVDVGVRTAEIVGFGAQGVGGIDFYLIQGLYFGFETKPVSYVYAYSNKIPAPGLETLKADTHTLSFFSQTFFKIGFRF